MKLGLLTSALGNLGLAEKVSWGKSIGLDALEVACWPKVNARDYSATDLDVQAFSRADAEKVQRLFSQTGLEISSLAYYDNNLHHDLSVRTAINNHLRKVIDAAQLLGVPLVGTFLGRNAQTSIEANMDELKPVFGPLVAYAADKGVKLMFENCSMPGWHTDGGPGTISYSPELWSEVFSRLPQANFGMNFDPSHLVWLGIDYLKAFQEFSTKIFHVHAKDVKVNPYRLYRYGIYGKQLNRSFGDDLGWFDFKIPGRGDVDWPLLFETLRHCGYDGTVSIEHEDRQFEGDLALVKQGIQFGFEFLKNHVPASTARSKR